MYFRRLYFHTEGPERGIHVSSRSTYQEKEDERETTVTEYRVKNPITRDNLLLLSESILVQTIPVDETVLIIRYIINV